MPSRREIAAAFDAIADEFDASRPSPWPETIAFERTLPPKSAVLDLACGGGRNAVFFRDRGHHVVGLDASGMLLARAAAKVGPAALVRGDLVCLPFRDATFDAVHCVAALHHLPSDSDRRQGSAEIARTLRPRGQALISTWALEQDRFRASAADVVVPWRRADDLVVNRFYHLFQDGELEDLCAHAGLAVVRRWREGDNHVLIAAKR